MTNTLETFVVKGAARMAEANGAGWDRDLCETRLRGWVRDILLSGGEIDFISSGCWTVSRTADAHGVEWQLSHDVLWADVSDGSNYDMYEN